MYVCIYKNKKKGQNCVLKKVEKKCRTEVGAGKILTLACARALSPKASSLRVEERLFAIPKMRAHHNARGPAGRAHVPFARDRHPLLTKCGRGIVVERRRHNNSRRNDIIKLIKIKKKKKGK